MLGAMPILQPPPAQVQPVPKPAPSATLPAWFPVPGGLEVRPDSVNFFEFDEEPMELRNPAGGALVRVQAEGRVWRFALRGEGVRMGALALQERVKEHLGLRGWSLVWPERGIARFTGEGRDLWFRTTAATGELRCVLVEKAPPPLILLPVPGPTPVLPKPDADFPYLPPWPGAILVATAPSQQPVGVTLANGEQRMVLVNWIDKEYHLARPISPHAFLTTYRAALLQAGWEIEGSHKGAVLELQALYQKEGRDLRATLRFAGGDAMGIAVSDVGAQVPGAGKGK